MGRNEYEPGDRVIVETLLGDRPGKVTWCRSEHIKVELDNGSSFLGHVDSVRPEQFDQ